MARAIEDIQTDILKRIAEQPALSGLTSTSQTAIYRLITYVVSYAVWLLEKFFDTHKKEVENALKEQKSGSIRWYRNKSLDYQDGFDLLPGKDRFNNEGAAEKDIKKSKIIRYAAVTESQDESRLIIKVATEQNEKLIPLTLSQTNRFKTYIKEIRYAGTPINVISFSPDLLYLTIDIYRNPLVLNEKGVSLRSGEKPVEQAITQHLKTLPFNGEFVIQSLVDCLQKVEGVRIVNVIKVECSSTKGRVADYGPKQPISVYAIPSSGYFEVANFDEIDYVVQNSDK
ncbi:MAG: nucleotidyltransferase [Flavobacteriales bacterium]